MTPRTWTLKGISILLTLAMTFTVSLAQAQNTNRMVKRNVATVLFATLGGAVLGLSTLSFYGEPQEHTDNVSVGALLGLIGGLSYVVYDSAKSPGPRPPEYSLYSDQELKTKRALASTKALPLVQFQISF